MINYIERTDGNDKHRTFYGTMREFLGELRLMGYTNVAPDKFYGVLHTNGTFVNSYITIL